MSTAPTEVSPRISRFDAESATAMTADFLRRLGYEGGWLPMKVSLDGELYVVEMMFHKLSAKVQINSKTKEIREYEFQKGEGASNSLVSLVSLVKSTKGKIIFLVAAISIAVVVVKLIGIF